MDNDKRVGISYVVSDLEEMVICLGSDQRSIACGEAFKRSSGIYQTQGDNRRGNRIRKGGVVGNGYRGLRMDVEMHS